MARRSRSQPVIIEVVTSRIYKFEKGEINGWDTDQVIKDWFQDHPIGPSFYHATREGHVIGNSELLISAREIDNDSDHIAALEAVNKARYDRQQQHERDIERRWTDAVSQITPGSKRTS